MSRATFDAVGGYVADTAEDLQFFLKFLGMTLGHMAHPIVKVELPLHIYRFYGTSVCSLVTKGKIRYVSSKITLFPS
jgi:hypothetical protein